MPAFLCPLEINSYWRTKNKCDVDPVFLSVAYPIQRIT